MIPWSLCPVGVSTGHKDEDTEIQEGCVENTMQNGV